jgi:hypothetical protein
MLVYFYSIIIADLILDRICLLSSFGAVGNFKFTAAEYIAKNITSAGILNPLPQPPKELICYIDIATLNVAIVTAVPNGFLTESEKDNFVRTVSAERDEARAEARADRGIQLQRNLSAIRDGRIEDVQPIAIPLGG